MTTAAIIRRFMSFVKKDKRTGCWLWIGQIVDGRYGRFPTRVDGDRWAHRVAYRLFVGPIPKGKRILHSCDSPPCVNPDHLFVGSQKDNIQDMVQKGRGGYRSFHGEDHWKARLNEKQVLAIKASTKTRKELAAEYGVSTDYIKHIRSSRAWNKTKGTTNVYGRHRQRREEAA